MTNWQMGAGLGVRYGGTETMRPLGVMEVPSTVTYYFILLLLLLSYYFVYRITVS